MSDTSAKLVSMVDSLLEKLKKQQGDEIKNLELKLDDSDLLELLAQKLMNSVKQPLAVKAEIDTEIDNRIKACEQGLGNRIEDLRKTFESKLSQQLETVTQKSESRLRDLEEKNRQDIVGLESKINSLESETGKLREYLQEARQQLEKALTSTREESKQLLAAAEEKADQQIKAVDARSNETSQRFIQQINALEENICERHNSITVAVTKKFEDISELLKEAKAPAFGGCIFKEQQQKLDKLKDKIDICKPKAFQSKEPAVGVAENSTLSCIINKLSEYEPKSEELKQKVHDKIASCFNNAASSPKNSLKEINMPQYYSFSKDDWKALVDKCFGSK